MRKIMAIFGHSALVTVSALGVGCSGTRDPQPEDTAPTRVTTRNSTSPEVANPKMFTRTIVTLRPGQPPAMQVIEVTAQQVAEDAARRLAYTPGSPVPDSLTLDPSCSLSDVEIWDGTDYSGNTLCVYNSSSTTAQVLDLAYAYRSYCGRNHTPCDPWYESGDQIINSIAIGNQDACLSEDGVDPTDSCSFSDWCYDNCSPPWGSESSNPGSQAEYEFLWVDYGTNSTNLLCTSCY